MTRPPMPDDGVVFCERCHRWIRTGEPYKVVGTGLFAHDKMCLTVVR